jgi:hypothetical protein
MAGLIRKSGRVMLTVSAVLLIFSGLVIWHDYQPSRMTSAGRQPEILTVFLQRLPAKPDSPFWSVGLTGETPWPQDLKRACYQDPLLAKIHFSF